LTNPSLETDWQAKAASLGFSSQPFVDGRWVDPLTTDGFDVINADDLTVVATLPDCGAADVDRAVASARAAFQNGVWSDQSPSQRARILHRFADLIDRDAQMLGLLDTLQMGMPITQSVGAAAGASHMVRYAADLADKAPDLLIPSAATALALQIRRPQGVVAAITPWNYPVHVGLGRIAPALAAGNSVVLKPSEIAPLALLHLAALASEAGLPDGVLNALPGRGSTTGKRLALHRDVDCLAFTGSTATGLLLMQYAGQSNMKALQLECGGKSPQIVFDDGGDLDALADALIQGFTHNSGQICTAGSRILVADVLYDRLVAALASRIDAAVTGRALDPATMLGPLANATQFARVSQKLTDADGTTTLIARGTTSGGSPHEIAPHLYEARDPDAPLVQDEIFGPVAAVMRFRDADEAVRLANGTRYGLSASLWCSDFALAHQVVRQLRAGFVSVCAVASPQPADEGPMSGEPFGMSGMGAFGGIAGIQAYTRLQAATFHLK
jgi:acyl-CoA reductase-like NAD-dependent aldehyde dehydrogenase